MACDDKYKQVFVVLTHQLTQFLTAVSDLCYKLNSLCLIVANHRHKMISSLSLSLQNFRTSSYQSDCASKYHTNETSTTLETYVATMTGGPVGPSDMIGTANVTLINATW